jgi:hypothetical protein
MAVTTARFYAGGCHNHPKMRAVRVRSGAIRTRRSRRPCLETSFHTFRHTLHTLTRHIKDISGQGNDVPSEKYAGMREKTGVALPFSLRGHAGSLSRHAGYSLTVTAPGQAQQASGHSLLRVDQVELVAFRVGEGGPADAAFFGDVVESFRTKVDQPLGFGFQVVGAEV